MIDDTRPVTRPSIDHDRPHHFGLDCGIACAPLRQRANPQPSVAADRAATASLTTCSVCGDFDVAPGKVYAVDDAGCCMTCGRALRPTDKPHADKAERAGHDPSDPGCWHAPSTVAQADERCERCGRHRASPVHAESGPMTDAHHAYERNHLAPAGSNAGEEQCEHGTTAGVYCGMCGTAAVPPTASEGRKDERCARCGLWPAVHPNGDHAFTPKVPGSTDELVLEKARHECTIQSYNAVMTERNQLLIDRSELTTLVAEGADAIAGLLAVVENLDTGGRVGGLNAERETLAELRNVAALGRGDPTPSLRCD